MNGGMPRGFGRKLVFWKGLEMDHLQRNSGAGWLTRRDVLAGAVAVVVCSVPVRASEGTPHGVTTSGKVVKNARIKQSMCGGCLRKAGLDREQTAKLLVEMGVLGRDLVGKEAWRSSKARFSFVSPQNTS